jgi:hypothetical protein
MSAVKTGRGILYLILRDVLIPGLVALTAGIASPADTA